MDYRYIPLNELLALGEREVLPNDLKNENNYGLVLVSDLCLNIDSYKANSEFHKIDNYYSCIKNFYDNGTIYVGELTSETLKTFINDEDMFETYLSKRMNPYDLSNIMIAFEKVFWDESILFQLLDTLT